MVRPVEFSKLGARFHAEGSEGWWPRQSAPWWVSNVEVSLARVEITVGIREKGQDLGTYIMKQEPSIR